MLTLSSTKLHCVFTCWPCRGRTLGGMGSRPQVHLFFNEQMAAQIVWPLNKPANSPSQLITGTLHYVTAAFGEFPNPNPPFYSSVIPACPTAPSLPLNPASNWGSPPLWRTEQLIVWKLHRQCFYWRPALPLTLAAWALLVSQMLGLSSALKGLCPWGSRELAHTLCPAPVSALHLTPPEKDRKRDRREKSGV